MQTMHYKALWMSGFESANCHSNAEHWFTMFYQVKVETLCLVGRLITMREMSRHLCWPSTHRLISKEHFIPCKPDSRLIYLLNRQAAPSQVCYHLAFGKVEIISSRMPPTAYGNHSLILLGAQCNVHWAASRYARCAHTQALVGVVADIPNILKDADVNQLHYRDDGDWTGNYSPLAGNAQGRLTRVAYNNLMSIESTGYCNVA